MKTEDILRFIENRKRMPHAVSATLEGLEKMLFDLAKEYNRLMNDKDEEFRVTYQDYEEGETSASRQEAGQMISQYQERIADLQHENAKLKELLRQYTNADVWENDNA